MYKIHFVGTKDVVVTKLTGSDDEVMQVIDMAGKNSGFIMWNAEEATLAAVNMSNVTFIERVREP